MDFKFLFRSFVQHTRRLLSGRLIRVVELTRDGAKWNAGVSRLLEILLVFHFLQLLCESDLHFVKALLCVAFTEYVKVQF